MRIFFCLILIVMVLSSDLMSQVKITEYNVPISKAMRTMGYLNYNYEGTRDTTFINKGSIRLDYKNYYSSLPFSWAVNINVSGAYDNKMDTIDSKYILYSTLEFSSSINKYFGDSSIFFAFANLNAYKRSTFSRHIESNISGGLGIGRMIYATAFAKAIRVDEYLYSENLLKEHLTRDELIQLGNIVERRDEFNTKFNERGDVEFYNEIENMLIGTGKLINGNFDAHALLRTSEVLNRERIFVRNFGWNVTSGLKHQISYEFFDNFKKRIDYAFSINFSYPFNIKTQYNHSTSYVTDFKDYHEVQTNSELTYELTNLIDIYLKYQYHTSKFGSSYSYHNGSFGFIFYIENNFNIGIEGTLWKLILDYPNQQDYINQLRTLINVNVGYRIF